MQNLTMIENELVPVYETSTGEKVVYGTELYGVLEVKSRFNDWVRNRFNDCEATENEDYEAVTKNLVSGGLAKEYIIKLDTAKEMAMLERNQKGRQVRRYFIQVEKKYNEVKTQKKITPSASDRVRIMEMNARSRMAQTYLKLSQVDTLSSTYKTVLVAKASEVLSGEELIPLPKIEQKTYSAGEIGKKFGISANMIGRIANKHNLKIEKYGCFVRDAKKNGKGECDTWRYYETVIPALESILNVEVA